MSEDHHKGSYHAKTGYQFSEAASGYEKRDYYRGLLGRYRKFREKQAIQSAIQQFMRDCTILDCPCGRGRWFELLGRRATKIIGMDVSQVMVDAAGDSRVKGVSVDARLGDAEEIDLEDNSVEHVFSYALMKHLPPEVKVRVMTEFARVSTGRIVVSFGVFNPIGKLLWRINGSHEWPVWWSEIKQLASIAKLEIGAVYRVGMPVIGLEYVVVFERIPN